MKFHIFAFICLTAWSGYIVSGALTESGNTDMCAEDEYKAEEKIYVTGEQVQGNMLGYSLLRTPQGDIYYEHDMPYLLDEAVVGRGIFVSEYVCETEVFLGGILRELLEGRGNISGESRVYFTEWALQQVDETDWELLEEGWVVDPYAYDRWYQLNDAFGGNGYDFVYIFYADKEKMMTGETDMVLISLSVNSAGQIYQIRIKIETVSAEKARMEAYVNRNGLFDYIYGEYVIQDGHAVNERMVWDFEKFWRRFMYPDETYEQCDRGLLISGNISASAESLGNVWISLLENSAEEINEELCGSEAELTDFADSLEYWRRHDENWTAAENYDCLFMDYIYMSGRAGFRYCFYPDYEAMGVDVAKAVVIDCQIDITDGKLFDAEMKIFPMTREECQKAGESGKEEGRVRIVEKGNVLQENVKTAIPVPDRQLLPVPVSEVELTDISGDSYERKEKDSVWGFQDAGETADFLGQKFLKDIRDGDMRAGEISMLCVDKDRMWEFFSRAEQRFMEDGWEADDGYDCYYIRRNEVAGCMHLQYYFYPGRTDRTQESGRTMVVDVYLSERGIESMKVNEYREEF